jgi:hypothetical protein
MPTFKKCDESVREMADELIKQFHQHLLDNKVKLDFVFAYGDKDENTGELIGNALTKNGCKALGVTRKLPLKDRAMGRGDAEIALDGDWWDGSTDAERRALLDHELNHIATRGQTDDLQRPMLRLRAHDFEFGWFKVIAERHKQASQECQQAKVMVDRAGQAFWPALDAVTEGTRMSKLEHKESTVTINTGATTTGPIPLETFNKAVKTIRERQNP